MLLRFVIIRLLIVIYSVRTRSVTVVFAVLPFAVVLPVSAVTVAVSVSVPFPLPFLFRCRCCRFAFSPLKVREGQVMSSPVAASGTVP